MKERTSHLLFTYWNEVRASRLAPRRFEIEPSRIASILPETFVLERQSRSEYPFRLAGTRLCEQFMREFRGRNLLELWQGEDREAGERVLESVCRDGAVGVIGFEASARTRRRVTCEMVLLPLVHSGNEISRLLGSIAIAEQPSWLGSEPLWETHITSFNLIWPDGKPHAVVSRLERQAPFARNAQAARIVKAERRSFRVYDGGLTKDGSGEG